MEKDSFLELIQNKRAITQHDLKALEQIAIQYPYAQLGHFLIAKFHYKEKNPQTIYKIRLAAAYASHRKALKDFILSPISTVTSIQNQSSQNQSSVIEEPVSSLESPIVDELLHNLNELRKAKEQTLNKLDHSLESTISTTNSSIEENTSTREEDVLLDYLHSLDNKKEYLQTEEGEEKDKKNLQWELIDRFINYELSEVSKLYSKKMPGEEEERDDLSMPSVREDTSLISENLAIIMAKQGKIDKAIDIYRKLIWKYPHKKTYFASRMEELKNIL